MSAYNVAKSAQAVINEFTSDLETYILDPDEALTTAPSGFVNLTMSTLGKLSTYSWYEMQMEKQEINASTAVQLKSLMSHLKSSDLAKVYGSPATMTFVLAYSLTDILAQAVANTTSGDKELRLNKDTILSLSDYPQYTLDLDIVIHIKTYENGDHSYYAVYDTSEVYDTSLITIADPYLSTRSDVIISGETYFAMYIAARQYVRTYNIYSLNGTDNDKTISYTNNLMGFTVLYQAASSTTWSIITAYTEGQGESDGVEYSLNFGSTSNTINITFSKIPDYFNPTSGTLKIVVYTTEGTTGNFTLPDIENNVSGLTVEFSQDRTDPEQLALISIIPIGSLYSSESSGGTDAKTKEEIRSYIVNDSGSTVITPGNIEKTVSSYGYSAYKIRNDLQAMEWRVTGFITNSNSVILPTALINASYKYTDVPIKSSVSARIITPKDVFRYNSTSGVYEYITQTNLNTYADYATNYADNLQNDMSFPFYIRISTGSEIALSVYDLSINKTISTVFKYMSTVLLDKMSITDMVIVRNPLNTTVYKTDSDGTTHLYGNYYIFQFTVTTSAAIIDNLKNLDSTDNPYVKFRLSFTNTISDTTEYVVDCAISNMTFDTTSNTILCKAFLETDNAIDSTSEINIINNSVSKLPYTSIGYSFYFLNNIVDVQINILFLATSSTTRTTSDYDAVLTSAEVSANYYIGIVYDVGDVYLAQDLSDQITIYPDVKVTEPTYKVASTDIADTYSSIIYKTNANGTIVTESTSLTNADDTIYTNDIPVILHNKGDTKQQTSGRITSYNALTAVWGNESTTLGIYDTGTVMDGNKIYASVTYNGIVIFGGEGGRVCCYDSTVTGGAWYAYNSTSTTLASGAPVIINSGAAMGNSAIRGMMIYNPSSTIELLIVYGDNGRVASCNLLTGVWKYYNGTNGDNIAIIYDDGDSIGTVAIYSAIVYNKFLIFGGSNGRIITYNATLNTWYGYSTTPLVTSGITNSGTVLNSNAIYTMVLYSSSILIVSGVGGLVGSCDLSTGIWTNYNATSGIRNDGTAIDGKTVYTSFVTNGIYVIAGQSGYIASYNIITSVWTAYDSTGFCNNGAAMGNKNIFTSIVYDTVAFFGGAEGYIITYYISTNTWVSYNSSTSSIHNDGTALKNDVATFVICGSIIYIGGKDGNIIYKYKKGDSILDSSGNPIIDTASSYIGYLKGLPTYNRIYAVKSIFLETVKDYWTVLTNLTTLLNQFPDGCTLSMGVNTTSGSSSMFKYYNSTTETTSYIDNVALAIKLGIKFNDNVLSTDYDYLITQIKTAIVTYITALASSTSTTFSVQKMLTAIKNDISGINYFEFYGINNYSASACQTITKDTTTTTNAVSYTPNNEALTIRYVVDDDNSDFITGDITFIPDITITTLS
jgi:hypothetical protein